MDEKETAKKLMLTALGFVSISKQKIEELLDEYLKENKTTQQEGEKVYGELSKKYGEIKEELDGKFKEVTDSIYEKLHISSNSEIEALKKRIEELEKKGK